MVLTIEASPVPLTISESGIVRVTNTRVTLDSIIYAFEEGATAEEIAFRFPTLRLVDIYAVITYYLNNKMDVKAYLEQEQRLDDEVRVANQSRKDVSAMRERLLARRSSPDRSN